MVPLLHRRHSQRRQLPLPVPVHRLPVLTSCRPLRAQIRWRLCPPRRLLSGRGSPLELLGRRRLRSSLPCGIGARLRR